jgi:hypothetical protein
MTKPERDVFAQLLRISVETKLARLVEDRQNRFVISDVALNGS